MIDSAQHLGRALGFGIRVFWIRAIWRTQPILADIGELPWLLSVDRAGAQEKHPTHPLIDCKLQGAPGPLNDGFEHPQWIAFVEMCARIGSSVDKMRELTDRKLKPRNVARNQMNAWIAS